MSNGVYSIILPTQGGPYLLECVESVLNQSNPNLELIILKSHGEDDFTRSIRTLNDKRIRLLVEERYLNIEENWNRILNLKKCPYMMIMGHDDLLDEDFLSTVDYLIRQNPKASLYETYFRMIDYSGNTIRPCRPIAHRETASDYLASRLNFIRDSYVTGYVFRSEDYESLGGIPLYPSLLFADDVLWVKLMQRSEKIASKKISFSYRYHKNSTSRSPDEHSLFSSFLQYSKFLRSVSLSDKEIQLVMNVYWEDYLKYFCNRYLDYRIGVQELDGEDLDKVNTELELFGLSDRYVNRDIVKRRIVRNCQKLLNYLVPTGIQSVLKTGLRTFMH